MFENSEDREKYEDARRKLTKREEGGEGGV